MRTFYIATLVMLFMGIPTMVLALEHYGTKTAFIWVLFLLIIYIILGIRSVLEIKK